MDSSPTNPYGFSGLTQLATTIACVLMGIFFLFYVWNRLIGPSRGLYVLLCGPPSCGKTKLYTQIAYGKTMETLASQMPNISECDLSTICSCKEGVRPKSAKIVDIPGSRQLLARFLPEHVPFATAVIFLLKYPSSSRIAATADCVLQLVEASLLGLKRKNSSLRVLFLILPDDTENVVFSSVVQNVQNQLQTEIDRLTRTKTDAVQLGGEVAKQSDSGFSLAKLAYRVDWAVSPVDKEDDVANAQVVADWLMK